MTKSINQEKCLVSIILPVQGTAAELDGTIEHVLAQSQTRWTMWLVESSDVRGAAARWVGRDERIRVVSHGGTGRGAALLAGLAQCRSPYTLFLDTEHRWAPNFLALTTGFLAANPLMDMVCTDVRTEDNGLSTAPNREDRAEHRRSIYREKAPLRTVLEPDGRLITAADVAGLLWHGGELASHLRRGEYTRMAVTLMTTEAAQSLAPALVRGGAALDYRLQARLAQACSANLLGCSGAVRVPVAVSRAAALRHEVDALAVFDGVFGRQHETDAELDALRCERLARIRHLSGEHDSGKGPLGRLWAGLNALCSVQRPLPARPHLIDTVTGQLVR